MEWKTLDSCEIEERSRPRRQCRGGSTSSPGNLVFGAQCKEHCSKSINYEKKPLQNKCIPSLSFLLSGRGSSLKLIYSHSSRKLTASVIKIASRMTSNVVGKKMVRIP
jgi:hypothetical protein